MSKVLVIDDEPLLHRIIKVALRASGYEVTIAGSGREGIEAALRERPDVILLDVLMPDMDGPAVLREILGQSSTANVRIIFMTGMFGEERDVDAYVALGANGVIFKPFRPFDLAASMERILAGETRSG